MLVLVLVLRACIPPPLCCMCSSCACLLVFLLLAALASVATWYVLATQPQRAEALRQWIEPILAHEQVQRVHQLTSDALRRFTDEL